MTQDGDKLRAMVNGYRQTALLCTAVQIGVIESLREKPKTLTQLASELGANADALLRLLRALCVLQVCEQTNVEEFQLSAFGRKLLPDDPEGIHSLAMAAAGEYVESWMALTHTMKTGDTAFDHVFGMTPWEHRTEHPHLNEHFNNWLAASTAGVAEKIVEAFNFSRFKTVADIGGGGGAFISALLNKHPQMNAILFDAPHVVEATAKQDIARCKFVAGDFFQSIAVNADAFILKSVLHDWNDERSVVILRNCREAMKRGESLIVIERTLPDRAEQDPTAIMIDMHMLAVTGGRERTFDQYTSLLESSGFRITQVSKTSTGFSIIEAHPVD